MRTILTLFLILFITLSSAQDKVEIEKSVKKEEVPLSAVEDLAEILEPNHKVKWYYQEDGEKMVYEAKFKYQAKTYSVEFDKKGLIYNVEITVDYDELNPKFISELEKKLDELFEDFDIRKIQIEYLGEDDDLFDLISGEEIDDDLRIQYEFEINAKSANGRELHELIFDDSAKLLSNRKIKLKSTDILDY
jgi:hypothetical protein